MIKQTTIHKTKNNRSSQTFFLRHLENEKGIAIVMALLFLVLLAALVPFAMQKTIQDTTNTAGFQSDKRLFFLADSGIQAGKNSLYNTASNGLDDELSTNGGVILNNVAFAGGTYTVTATDNNDGDADTNADLDDIVFLTSQATINGETKTIRALVRAGITVWTAPGGVLSDGNIDISGNPTIAGSMGGVHANGNVHAGGSPSVAQSVTAHGTVTLNNPGAVAGGGISGVPEVDIPPDVANLAELSDWMDATFKQYADWVLDADGVVTAKDGTILADLGGNSGTWNDWDYDPGKPEWKYAGGGHNNPGDGMYYFDGTSASIGSNPWNWDMTMVAEGHIEMSGNPEFTNYKNPADPVGVQNVALMALYDLKLNGNPNQSIVGILYCGQQFGISGNPSVNGTLIAKDFATASLHGADHISSEPFVSGNMTLTYNGGLEFPPEDNTVQVSTLSWQEQ